MSSNFSIPTHLSILYADRSEFERKRFSPPIDTGTPGDFFRRSRQGGTSTLFPGSIEGRFKTSGDKISQPDWLTLLANRSDERRKSREQTHLANAGKFSRRYLTCPDIGDFIRRSRDRRKSQSLHRAHLAIFAVRGDRRIKLPGVSPALINRFYY